MTTLAHVVSASIKGWAGALVALGMVCGIAGDVSAQTDSGYKIYTKAGKFDDVSEALKDAILKRGFVVDYTGELNKMLDAELAKRTPQVIHIINIILGGKRKDELFTPLQKLNLGEEIKNQINMILRDGKISEVMFEQLVVS